MILRSDGRFNILNIELLYHSNKRKLIRLLRNIPFKQLEVAIFYSSGYWFNNPEEDILPRHLMNIVTKIYNEQVDN